MPSTGLSTSATRSIKASLLPFLIIWSQHIALTSVSMNSLGFGISHHHLPCPNDKCLFINFNSPAPRLGKAQTK